MVISYGAIESLAENGYLSETTSVDFDKKKSNKDCSGVEEKPPDLKSN